MLPSSPRYRPRDKMIFGIMGVMEVDVVAKQLTANWIVGVRPVAWRAPVQNVVNAGRIESERLRIFLAQLAPTLVQPAVDQDPLPGGRLDHVTRTGDAAVGAVKR